MYDSLVRWFRDNQRPLPWRVAYDPYHVWVCEVMLQQTQVEAALPYYERFLAEFPNVRALAKAGEQEVLTRWSGLGYYSRARNLHAAAKIVAREHAGAVPDDYETLRSLPGIGPYMAGAIMSIAFNRPYAIVDGNVRRVLSRLRGWTGDNSKQLWEEAERLVKLAEPRAINQALMELGATVCSFKAPRCLLCPLREVCVAFKTGAQDRLPAVKKRRETIRVLLFAVVDRRKGLYLMRQVKGLWEFPMFGELPAGAFSKVGACRHTITHHRLEVNVYTGKARKVNGLEWKDFNAVPVSSLTRKIFMEVPLPTGEGDPKGRVRGTK